MSHCGEATQTSFSHHDHLERKRVIQLLGFNFLFLFSSTSFLFNYCCFYYYWNSMCNIWQYCNFTVMLITLEIEIEIERFSGLSQEAMQMSSTRHFWRLKSQA